MPAAAAAAAANTKKVSILPATKRCTEKDALPGMASEAWLERTVKGIVRCW